MTLINKPTTKQARKIINKLIKDNNIPWQHYQSWTDKTNRDWTDDRYLCYRTGSRELVSEPAVKMLNEQWPGCAKISRDWYLRVKCTIA